MKWIKAKIELWISADGVWKVRKKFGIWWVYCGDHRYTPTGRYNDSVSFKTAKMAMDYINQK